jgi:2-keto-4-pentenoate hydratase
MSPDDEIAQALLNAYRGGPAADDARMQERVTSVPQAYAIQERLVAMLGNAPGVPRYWKSGAPSRSDPIRHAALPDGGVRASGAGIDGLHLRNRWIEAEVALRLGQAVTPQMAQAVQPQDVASLVDGMCVSIELVDTRWASGRAAPPLLKVADLLVHGGLVLGSFVPFAPLAWDEQECRVRIGDADARSFRGSLGVRDPIWVLPEWLRHVTRQGATVPAGTVVSTGTWCGLLEAQPGDAVVAEFPGIGHARVQL